MNFHLRDPQKKRFSIMPEEKPMGTSGVIVIIMQLSGLFLVVRLLMVERGIRIISIPLVDPLLHDLIVWAKRSLTQFGLS